MKITFLGPQKLRSGLILLPRWLHYRAGSLREQTDTEQKLRAVTRRLQELILMVQEQRPEGLKNLVHPQEGIYVDLKAHWSYEKLMRAIQSGRGYLYDLIFSEKEDLSVYNTLKLSPQIEIDYYITDQAKECEFKLHLSKVPQASYQLNNPVFIYKAGRWYVYRLF